MARADREKTRAAEANADQIDKAKADTNLKEKAIACMKKWSSEKLVVFLKTIDEKDEWSILKPFTGECERYKVTGERFLEAQKTTLTDLFKDNKFCQDVLKFDSVMKEDQKVSKKTPAGSCWLWERIKEFWPTTLTVGDLLGLVGITWGVKRYKESRPITDRLPKWLPKFSTVTGWIMNVLNSTWGRIFGCVGLFLGYKKWIYKSETTPNVENDQDLISEPKKPKGKRVEKPQEPSVLDKWNNLSSGVKNALVILSIFFVVAILFAMCVPCCRPKPRPVRRSLYGEDLV